MSSPHRLRHALYMAPAKIKDPGYNATASKRTITIDKDGGVCPVVTTGVGDTRILRRPTKAGIIGTIVLYTDGGDLGLTVTGGYNEDGDMVITFDDAGDFVTFISIDVGGTYYWRVLGHEGTDLVAEDIAVDQIWVSGTAVIATGAIGTATLTTATITTAKLAAVSITQSAPVVVVDGDTAMTAVELLTKILVMNSTTAGRAPTVPTGTAMNGVVDVGYAVDWCFMNLGNQTVTITAATAHTLVGTMTLATLTSGMFRTRVSSANTAITYRLGT